MRLFATAALLLVTGRAWAADGTIAVDAGDGCPDRAQVGAALEARLPGVTGRGAYTRRLELERDGGELILRLRAFDGGEQYLERRLPLDQRATNEACEALAEAVAQVVVRYLREIGYRPPQPAAVVEVVPN
ncbi:MAG TPA: hypothetical protein VN914_14435, partial [Polyangia bacterium]|nr:hypothetical protein [Polyangia bacterium]